ncbi:unnamed protein product [Thelazia callipaeda]|uniref:N(4)-(beta-N-acetylglucosaminyl)-L-asparaginase n=1 Tax=Thelazia callipaeda TaxID=103827 RepID=A0A0N5CRF3_THECL|nr:unnamed protein product [Thelazia callipaeda]
MKWFSSLFHFISLLLLCKAEVPMVLTTWGNDGFQAATGKAFSTLIKTHDRMESLLAGLTECERLQCDYTVGFGGSPDELGETRLDALVFDGPHHKMGAVGSLPNVRNAARVAYAVMKYTKHSILVGDHAASFAFAMGFKREPLISNYSHAVHKKWIAQNCQPNYRRNVRPDARQSCGPYKPAKVDDLSNHTFQSSDHGHDTIGLIVIDFKSNIAVGTSTNGANHKVPGRIGDSPLPGAGAYVDNDVGGAASTGDGDIMMRFLSSFQAVQYMREGNSPSKATEMTIRLIAKKYPYFIGAVIAANKTGGFGASCHGMKTFKFCVQKQNFEKVKVISVNCV